MNGLLLISENSFTFTYSKINMCYEPRLRRVEETDAMKTNPMQPGQAEPGPIQSFRLTRRAAFAVAGAGLIALTGPRPVAAVAPADDEIAKILKGRTAKETGLKLDVPSIAENGLVVPLSVDVDSPMTDADYVKSVHVIAAGNPNPLVVAFHFTPLSGKASAATRMRLAQTQDVIAIAEMSNGEVRMAKSEVKVTIGGCGG